MGIDCRAQADPRSEDDDAIRGTLGKAGVDAADIGLSVVNKSKVEAEGSTGTFSIRGGRARKHQPNAVLDLEPPKYFQFESQKGGLDYQITSLGHSIDLKTEYPKSSLRKCEIKLRKGRDLVMKSTYIPCSDY